MAQAIPDGLLQVQPDAATVYTEDLSRTYLEEGALTISGYCAENSRRHSASGIGRVVLAVCD